MMFIARLTIAVCVTILWTVVASSAFALSLDEAKASGLVGEKATGYLGAVTPANAEAQALIEDVNRKRRQAYEDIAKRNGTSVQSVETLAGEKAVQNTKPGNFVQGPGGWIKK
ncbi:MAG: YdbL family protein [Nitrospira sp.]|nr:YdbL family protein [Nitrospira sp.]